MTDFCLQPELSGILDAAHGTGIVLDESSGRYWRMAGTPLILLAKLATDPGFPVDPSMTPTNRPAFDALLAAGLIRDGGPRLVERPHPTHRQRRRVATTAVGSPTARLEGQSLAGLVLSYALRNAAYGALLRTRGWRPVRARLRAQRDAPAGAGEAASPGSACPDRWSAMLAAAVRLGSLMPFVRRRCVQHSLALYDLTRSFGMAPRIRIGATVVPFEPHMWIEVKGCRLDSWAEDDSLAVFLPLAAAFRPLSSRALSSGD